MTDIARNIKRLRNERCLSQEQLADQLGVTRQTIISLENGKYNAARACVLSSLRIRQRGMNNYETIFFIAEANAADFYLFLALYSKLNIIIAQI